MLNKFCDLLKPCWQQCSSVRWDRPGSDGWRAETSVLPPQLQQDRHSRVRELREALREAAHGHRGDLWLCCGMTLPASPRLYLYSCQPESPSFPQPRLKKCLKYRKLSLFYTRTLGGKGQLLDFFFLKFFNFLFQENRFCGSCHRIIQLLLKTNILNIQNADFSYISTVKQYSILKDYYYFCKR